MSDSTVERAVEVFVDGFAEDPWFRWLWPDHEQYPARAQAWFHLITEAALDRGEVLLADDDAAAAIWTPPGASLADDKRLAVQSALLLRSQLGDQAATEAAEALAASAAREPAGPHYSCVYVAVKSSARGRGRGQEVMGPPLAACDRDGIAAHLVSTNRRNLSFYRRLGFDSTENVPVGEGTVEFRQMWRTPQRMNAASRESRVGTGSSSMS